MKPVGKSNPDTNRIGEISEAAILTRFLQLGYIVLTPYGGNQRYDLVIEDANRKLWRIQCKSAWLDKNKASLTFSTSISNVTGKNRQPRNYRGQCDYFAVYNRELQKVYLIPVDEVGIATARLWIAPTKRQEKNIHWAKDYEL
jgi:PD-(D/E)XK endonuclease